MMELVADGRVWFGRDGNAVPRLKRFLVEARLKMTPETLWTSEVVGTTTSAKRHLLSIFKDEELFDTPKPEELVHRILTIASNPGDLVLDAYLGSGTTSAVAHKIDRRWIGIECGPHAVTHCAERLRQVVDGEAGGISEAVGWRGGGGFDFLREREQLKLAA
jgi:adenine-specific DNA-methyltransferase